jgi:lysophospholipase L1-like esterase
MSSEQARAPARDVCNHLARRRRPGTGASLHRAKDGIRSMIEQESTTAHQDRTARPRRGTPRAAMAALLVLVVLLGGAAACGSDGDGDDEATSSDAPEQSGDESSGDEEPADVEDPEQEPAEAGSLGDGPVTVVAVGDSLTYGEGDEEGLGGFVGRVTEAIGAESGREGSTLENLGISGWTSDMVINGEGEGGAPGQLPAAVDTITEAVDSGSAVLATYLIGSNDMWFLYEYGEGEGTSADAEEEMLEVYRANVDQTITELQDAGAFVVVGLPDDQSIRPAVVDIEVLNQQLANVTEEEVAQMSELSVRMDEIMAEVAAEHGAPVVDTNGSYWADQETMADDGIHPNAAGYQLMADQWLEVIQPAL